MAKKATITPVTDTVNNASAINTQLNAINNQLDNTLSLDGSTPNAMNADLDMNSNDLLNVGTLAVADLTVAGVDFSTALGASVTASAASAADAATSAAESALSSSVEFATRSDLIIAIVASGEPPANGLVYRAGGLQYKGHTGATDIADIPSIKPYGDVFVEHFGDEADNLPIFNEAVAYCAGSFVLHTEGGKTYLLDGELLLPSLTTIKAAGAGKSTLRQTSTTMADNVVTTTPNTRLDNATTVTGIYLHGLIFDGDYSRNAGPYTGVVASGGCGLSLCNVDGFEVVDCEAINCTKHGFDITSAIWNVSGDSPTSRPLGGSKTGRLIRCTSTIHGDDGITTHYSSDIEIIDCEGSDSGGHYNAVSAGVEIDDGSYNITVTRGFYRRNIDGCLVKGHSYAPAARNVHFHGVTSESNHRNYRTIHDGFDTGGGTISASAYDVTFTDCVSIVPRKKGTETDDVRAMSLTSYGGVVVTDMLFIGDYIDHPADDPSYLTATASTSYVAVFGNGRNARLVRPKFRGVREATTIIQCNSSSFDTHIIGAEFDECSGLPIQLGSGISGMVIDGLVARTTFTPVPAVVIDATNSPTGADYTIKNVRNTGYTNNFDLDNELYPKGVDVDRAICIGRGITTPEGSVPSPRGSTFHVNDGASSGLYIKETGSNTSTGWALV